jgi:predicted Zn-dependent peptidase
MPTSTKLKNGLRLIVAPQQSTQAATVLVVLPVGSRYERPDINGVSHFVEHLLFKGTEKRPTTLDISRELDAIGAEYNAFTSKDHTGYYIKLASAKLELAFDILSDMLLNSTFPEAEINKERGVIVEEINMYDDNPLMLIDSLLEQAMFRNHPLGWNIAGPKKVIQTVSREKILAYKNAHYAPSNMVLAVTGNVKTAQVQKLATKYFNANTKKIAKIAYSPVKIQQKSPSVIVKEKATEQVQVCLGMPSYPMGHKDLPALSLLSVILGGNMSSRLFVSVREERGLAYFVRASADAYQDTGVFAIQAGLDKSRVDQAITLILAELKKVVDGGVTAKELADAKEFIYGKMVLALEDSEHVADWYAKQLALQNKTATPEERMKKIKAVKLADVQRVAKAIIRPETLNLAVIGPFKDIGRFKKLLKF